MLNCQVVRAVALLLPVSQKNSSEQHLLLAIVKALATFTNHRSDECAQQVIYLESCYSFQVLLLTLL
jgi:MarR-like DNA-binding transcriptional regulator SgrR of sgrS sRNA